MTDTLIEPVPQPGFRARRLVPVLAVARWPLRHRRAATASALLAVVAALHTVNIGGWPAFFDDEGTYLSQAWAVRSQGELTPYTYWYDHPPVGWIQIAALEWLPAALLPSSVPALVGARLVMVVFALATTVLIYLLGRNLGMRPVTAGGAALLWAVSPLVVFHSRQVFLDNVALPWLLAAFVLVTSPRRLLWFHVAAGGCFAVAVLTKETMLLAGPALLVAVWLHCYRRARSFAVVAVVATAATVASLYPLMAVIRSELLPGPDHTSLWDGLVFQLVARDGSGFLLQPGTGAFGILQSWLDRDPVLMVAGVGAAVGALAVRRLRVVGLVAVSFIAVALRPDGYLPFMYVVALLPFAALAVAGLAEVAWSWARERSVAAGGVVLTIGALVVAGVPAAAAADHRTALTADVNGEHRQAVAYIEEHLPRDSVVVVDNTYWNDLVRAGWQIDGFSGAVWFYKVDQDPAAQEYIRDWSDIDYLLWTETIAEDPGEAPLIRAAYRNSEVVAGWGQGPSRVEIRRVEP